jgi:hypothetical protein
MKKLIYTYIVLAVLSSCNGFLEVNPETEFDDGNYWSNEAGLEAFSLGLYPQIRGYGSGSYFGGDHFFGVNNDDVIAVDNRLALDFLTAVPATSAGTNWSWVYIRKANVLIEGARKTPVAQSVKDEYEGIGRFFRAYLYWDKVQRYGDVPFYDAPVDPADDAALYAPRESRVDVVNLILEDLDFAIQHCTDQKDQVKITKWTALALKSRIALAAATTFKYHNVAGADVNALLNACVDASSQLMAGGFTLHDNYQELFASDNLVGNPEVIMVKIYNEYLQHSIHSFMFHEPFMGFSYSAMSSFLMADGRPISYDGASHPSYTEWTFNTSTTITTSMNSINTYVGIADGRDGRMAMIVDTTRVITLFSKGIPMFSPVKYATYDDVKVQRPQQGVNAVTDAPIFRLGEVLLNFAEAKAELGTITQADLDASINLLRDRAGVADLTVGVGFTADDLDPTVDPLLWEIRRERRVELMLEPFRKWDLIRWKKGEYYDAEEAYYAVKVDPAVTFQSSIDVIKTADDHLYAQAVADRRTVWDDRKYLEPLPADQLVLNPNLTQNTGWQ